MANLATSWPGMTTSKAKLRTTVLILARSSAAMATGQIGSRIDQQDQQLIFGKGYDHNWVLNRSGAVLTLAARMYDQGSERVVEVLTTEPGLQFTSAILSMAASAEKACASIQSAMGSVSRRSISPIHRTSQVSRRRF